MKSLRTIIRVSELSDISLRMVDFYKKEKSLEEDVFLKNIFEEISRYSIELTTAMKRENRSSKLKDSDKLRDETIKNLYDILKGYNAMRVQSTKASAEVLLGVFSKYGLKMTRESYASESALIESMLSDFAATEIQKHIEQLPQVKETIAELRERQTAFHQERLEYEQSVSETMSEVSASSLKKILLELINIRLVSFLTAVEKMPEYKNLCGVIRQVIKDANEAIGKRSKKTKKVSTDEIK